MTAHLAPDVRDAIMFRGADIPASITPGMQAKSKCPRCSATREKRGERCLSIRWRGDMVTFFCYHCGWRDAEVIE